MQTLARVDLMDHEAIRVAFPREQPRKTVARGPNNKCVTRSRREWARPPTYRLGSASTT